MKNYNSSGDVIKTTAPRAYESGEFVRFTALHGFVVDKVAAGGWLVIKTEGVFEYPALSDLEFGLPVYHTSSGELTGVDDSDPDTVKIGVIVGPGLLKLIP